MSLPPDFPVEHAAPLPERPIVVAANRLPVMRTDDGWAASPGGLVRALLPIGVNLPLSRELVFNIFLPPLIFEAALQMPWRRLRAQLPLTVTGEAGNGRRIQRWILKGTRPASSVTPPQCNGAPARHRASDSRAITIAPSGSKA